MHENSSYKALESLIDHANGPMVLGSGDEIERLLNEEARLFSKDNWFSYDQKIIEIGERQNIKIAHIDHDALPLGLFIEQMKAIDKNAYAIKHSPQHMLMSKLCALRARFFCGLVGSTKRVEALSGPFHVHVVKKAAAVIAKKLLEQGFKSERLIDSGFQKIDESGAILKINGPQERLYSIEKILSTQSGVIANDLYIELKPMVIIES